MKYSCYLILFLTGLHLIGQNPNDCINAIELCGATSIGVDPDGVGINEFANPGNNAPPCYSFNNNTVWFKFNIATGGNLGFDIIPNNGTDDFDFAIYGPVDDCANLGNSIRCSSTNPQNAGVSANTGLNSTETDLNEGPGADGNGYLKWLTVNDNETYYLLVDRAHGSDGFEININGSSTLPNPPSFNEAVDLTVCDDDGNADGQYSFDIGAQIAEIQNGHPNSIVTQHISMNDANIGQNPLPSTFVNTISPQTIYVRIENDFNTCSDITTYNLTVLPLPQYNIADQAYLCDVSAPHVYELSDISEQILDIYPSLDISFHMSQMNAQNNQEPIDEILLTTNTSTVYTRISNSNYDHCISIEPIEIRIEQSPQTHPPSDIVVCRDFRETITHDLSTTATQILGNLDRNGHELYFYESIADRENDRNELPLEYTTQAESKSIYIKVVNTQTGCESYEEVDLVVNESPDFEMPENLFYCLNSDFPLQIIAPQGYDYYEWSTGEEGTDQSSIYVTQGDTYEVTATNAAGCSSTRSVSVNTSNIATITEISVVRLNYPNNEITILVTGEGDYEYSLDNGPYQDINTFAQVERGYHTVAVRDKNGCGIIESNSFLVLDYPRFFTPNGDGHNDTWEIIGLNEFPASQLFIYDRYGKLLKQMDPQNARWDGHYRGALMAEADYWFTLRLDDGTFVRGHFSLVH